MSAHLFKAEDSTAAFRHEAFLYSGSEQFLEGTTAFIRGALEADEAVLVAVVEPRASMLKDALGADKDQVEFLDMAVVDRAHDTHPSVVVGDSRAGSTTYPHPGLTFPAMFGASLEEPAGPVLEVGYDPGSLTELRDFVAAFVEPVLGGYGAEHVVLVVSELATNSIVYGGGAGILRLWREGAAVVAETRDRGQITDPLVGRRRPTLSVRGKAGLWIANQLSDLLQLRSSPGFGTVVRAHFAVASWA